MKIFIPDLGTKLKLSKDWFVSVMNEDRNYSLLDALTGSNNQLKRKIQKIRFHICEHGKTEPASKSGPFFYPSHCYGMSFEEAVEFYNKHRYLIEEKDKYGVFKKVIIPNGAILEVDRIYIRQGNSGCSSITFKWRKDKKVLRFWAKLEDVNKIEAEVVGEIEENRKKNIPRCSIGG